MTATIIRFPDLVVTTHKVLGHRVRATTAIGRDMVSNRFGLPCFRPTEIEPVSLDVALRAGDVLAYDLPARGR